MPRHEQRYIGAVAKGCALNLRSEARWHSLHSRQFEDWSWIAAEKHLQPAAQAPKSPRVRKLLRSLAELKDNVRFAVVETVMHERKQVDVAKDRGVTPSSVWDDRKWGLHRLRVMMGAPVVS